MNSRHSWPNTSPSIAIHLPATHPEKELVEQIAIARWRTRRFIDAEAVLMSLAASR